MPVDTLVVPLVVIHDVVTPLVLVLANGQPSSLGFFGFSLRLVVSSDVSTPCSVAIPIPNWHRSHEHVLEPLLLSFVIDDSRNCPHETRSCRGFLPDVVLVQRSFGQCDERGLPSTV